MRIPPSPHFTPVDLRRAFNVDADQLQGSLRVPVDSGSVRGRQNCDGIPFQCGNDGTANALLLEKDPLSIELQGEHASYLLFLHVVEDRATHYQDGFADTAVDGNALGHHVSDYTLEYADGDSAVTRILRRFAIQQGRLEWGASPFAAQSALRPAVFPTVTEELLLGKVPGRTYGEGETRTASGRDQTRDHLWVYALPNPHPGKPISRIVLQPREERSLVFAISLTTLHDHPLRPGLRQKVRLELPEGVPLNALHELDDIAIDLGAVISARAALDYDHARWLGMEPNVQPSRAARAVVIEFAAHPRAQLYVGAGNRQQVYELSALAHFDGASEPKRIEVIPPARKTVTVRVVEKGSTTPVPARIHFHGPLGEYLPPRGSQRKVNAHWMEDNYGEHVNGLNQYAYIHGVCEVDLPVDTVYVEICKGYEVKPLRTLFKVTPETQTITFELERTLRWRERGWITADTHVHFLSPTTALLEGQAEGVNVVNLLASQWGEMYSNVTDFDGRTTLGARDFGGDGEFMVRVGTENRMQVLGHISLLGYAGAMIHPLCTGGPSESAVGDAQEVTMADWAERCIAQGGLVILPHAPNPQLERAADIVLGLVHGIELMTFNPHDTQLSPYGLADWYRYLNLGYHIPIVGGSDKMGQAWLLGGIRTYAQLGPLEFTYEHWMQAVKAGNTFVTVGPLIELQVDGVSPGGYIELPPAGGAINVTWKVESVSLPIEQVEVLLGGLVADQVNVGKQLSAQGNVSLKIDRPGWVALRVRGSYRGKHGEIAAHTSAVQLRVGGKKPFSQKDATAVLEQIEGALAYVDTLAPRPDALRFKRMRATLQSAHNRLHQEMHAAGVFHHHHTPLHDHSHTHEH